MNRNEHPVPHAALVAQEGQLAEGSVVPLWQTWNQGNGHLFAGQRYAATCHNVKKGDEKEVREQPSLGKVAKEDIHVNWIPNY